MISILERMAALMCFSKFSSDLPILCMFECFSPTESENTGVMHNYPEISSPEPSSASTSSVRDRTYPSKYPLKIILMNR